MLALFAAALAAATAQLPDLRTTFDQSGGLRTGCYEEVQRLCAAYARAFPEKVRCEPFGTSPEGRPMLSLVVAAPDARTPEAARAAKRPVILFQGGIHAGEIDGKDAGFLLLRELLEGKGDAALAGALEKATLVFVPVFNVDGHERFGRWNRPNQVGPEEMGWRTTAQNLNLNRDYAKADAPEMQALLRLLGRWDPAVYLDLHVTDGAVFQHDVAVLVAPTHGTSPLAKAGAELADAIFARLTAQRHLPITAFYPLLNKEDDPSSGFAIAEPPPRFSQAYWAARNRIGVLVETHSWKPYAQRVSSTHDTLSAVLAEAIQHGQEWLSLEARADAATVALPGQEVVLATAPGTHSHLIEFLGVAWTRTPSEISGASWLRYDPSKPEVWKVPLLDTIQVALAAKAPLAGYAIPAAFAKEIAARLELHGISFTTLREARPKLAVETFRATKATPEPATFEGRTRMALEGSWKPEARDLPAGSLYVPVAQPRGALAVMLLEPLAPDSFAAWGFFNACFEQKEYMEPYVAEQVARDLLAKDPSLKADFAAALEDPAFAKDPARRLDFFYRRTGSWDERFNLVPVYRLNAAP